MRNDNKLDLSAIIVWIIFLFALFVMLGFAIPMLFQESFEKCSANPREFRTEPDKEIVEHCENVESYDLSVSTEVADPLYGSDLYIFYIAQINEQYYPDVDPYITLSVLEVESNYQPNLVSKAGAVGLMQVIPKYHLKRAAKYGLNDIWDPYTNIICGMDFLNDLIHERGTWERALLGYNNSKAYVNHVITNAETLRAKGIFNGLVL